MPLPPAPSRRAALLAPEAYDNTAPARPAAHPASATDTPAATTRRRTRKSEGTLGDTPKAGAAPAPIQVETRVRPSEPIAETVTAAAPAARRGTPT
ncbi:PhoH family protein, partial [Acidovorax delafieldii 2AN]